MIYPIEERAQGAYSGAQWLLRLRSPEKNSGSGDQSVVESLREFSYMFPPNMMVIVFCTPPDSMYPGNLTRTILERGRLSARSADSSLPPNPAEKTRIRTSSGAEGCYLGAVRWEVSSAAPIRRARWARRLSRASSAWVQLRKSGAPKHIGRISGGVSWPGDRTVKQGARGRT